ncbi:MAG: PaaI family thioesterase [Acidimicrobiia bacterium]|jgi:uncharacterized protein (TIGR00369 family)
MITPAEVDAFVAEHFPSAHVQGLRCEALGDGFAVARWHFDDATLRPGGLISGPTQFALVDTALWFLAFTVLGLVPMSVTSDVHIVFLRPAAGADLLARAELLRAGRSRISGQVSVWVEGEEDRPVSHATGSYALLETR